MNKFIFLVFVLVFTTPFGKTLKAASTKTQNIMIISVDTAEGSLSRNSPIVRSAVRLLQDQLASIPDLAFYEEPAPGSCTNKWPEIPYLKRCDTSPSLITPPLYTINRLTIDIMTTIAVFASHKKIADAKQIRVRITSISMNPHTGKLLSRLQRETPFPVDMPLNCNEQCLSEKVSKITNELVLDLGADLKERIKESIVHIDDLLKRYIITFKDFRKEDLDDFQNSLMAFSGYAGHRLLKSTPDTLPMYYQTRTGRERLIGNLRRMLEHLDFKGRVEMSGHNIEITNIAP